MVRVIGLAVALASLGAGCTPEQQAPPSPSTSRSAVEVVVANYEIVAEASNRFIAGLITQGGRMVAYGTVQMRFAHDSGGSLEPTDPSWPGTSRYRAPNPDRPTGILKRSLHHAHEACTWFMASDSSKRGSMSSRSRQGSKGWASCRGRRASMCSRSRAFPVLARMHRERRTT